jgi:hypothetical protein
MYLVGVRGDAATYYLYCTADVPCWDKGHGGARVGSSGAMQKKGNPPRRSWPRSHSWVDPRAWDSPSWWEHGVGEMREDKSRGCDRADQAGKR